jgi:hypothetical protein
MGIVERGITSRFVGLVAVLLAVGLRPAPVGATGGFFHYEVERVVEDGNVSGLFDGSPDYVEEFDGALDTTDFRQLFGTAYTSEGGLVLESPGTPYDIPELGLKLVQSDVMDRAVAFLRDGAGNARLEVHFRPATLGSNHFVHATFVVNAPGAGETYYIGLAFTNYDGDVASREQGPRAIGPSMVGHSVAWTLGTYRQVAGNAVPVETSSALGAFVLALNYDDEAKTIRPTFSLDGGKSFQGGIDPLDVPLFDGSGQGYAGLIIGADPRESVGPPPTTGCSWPLWHLATTVSVARNGSGNVSLNGRGYFDPVAGVPNPVVEGMQLALVDQGTGSTLALLTGDAAIPPGAVGSGCDPRDGWKQASGSTFRYRNASDAFPPACVAGSADGLTRVTMRLNRRDSWDTKVQVALRGVPLTTPPLGPMSAVVVRGLGGNQEVTGACLALATPSPVACTRNASGKRLRCKN